MTPDQHIRAGLRDPDGKAIEELPGEDAKAHAHGGIANGDVYLGPLNGMVENFIRQ
jgi:hypothetical protein